MEFLVLQSFNNYVDAHLLLARLESEGIECWLKDENTVTIFPVWTNAVGGIKLLVRKEDYNRASVIFRETEKARKQALECPRCKGHNVDFISTPRKAGNWISAILGFLFISYALPVNTVYHCFDCGNEFENTGDKPPVSDFLA